ncbi:MAG: SBBP repeat-containing protein [Gammaproteobacteria bacterium]|nr:SBBP repeat-containing protein [Gammaproteobacteria bacterium]
MASIKSSLSILLIIFLIAVTAVLSKNISVQSIQKNESVFHNQPLVFEKNMGQFDSGIDFVSRNDHLNLYLAANYAKISFSRSNTANNIKIKFLGANNLSKVQGINQKSGKIHYFSGQKKEAWQNNVSLYEKVTYQSIYPGIDLIYHANHGVLEYDFVVAPNIDYQTIKLKFEGTENIELSETGDLLLYFNQGTIVQKAPLVYQEKNNIKQIIESQYLLADNNEVSFLIADYDETRALIIDPVLTYASYLGGADNEEGNDIAVDSDGNTYIIGSTKSVDFPINNSLQDQYGGGEYDLFISKFDVDNTHIFTSYLGGSGDDKGLSIAVDNNYIYIVGETNSRDFPTMLPIQSALAGDKNCNEGKDDCNDAFIAKLSADGSTLLFSTYLGGDNKEIARSIVVDDEENVYIAGVTTSYNFPVQNEIQSTLKQQEASASELRRKCGVNLNIKNHGDAFISKIDTNNFNYIFSTYFGGTCVDAAFGIDLDNSKNIFVTGMTASPDFPVQVDSDLCSNSEIEEETCLPFQEDFKFQTDIFLLKLNPEGNKILYSTYFGDDGAEVGLDIAVDHAGAAYITGYTDSPNLAHLNPFQGSHGGQRDAFVAKFSSEKGGLLYSSYLGGDKDDEGHSIAVNTQYEVYIAGKTSSDNFPVCNPIRSVYGGKGDAFISKFYLPSDEKRLDSNLCKIPMSNDDPGLLKLEYSSYLGGSAKDSIKSMVLDEDINFSEVLLVGKTKSTDLTTVNPLAGFTTNQGKEDLFIARLEDKGNPIDLSILVDDVQDPVEGEEDLNYIITLTNQGSNDANDIVISSTLSEGLDYISHTVDEGECIYSNLVVKCTFDRLVANNHVNVNILVRASRGGVLSNTVQIIRANESDPNLLNNRSFEETKVGIKGGGGGTFSAINLLFLLFYTVLLSRKRL